MSDDVFGALTEDMSYQSETILLKSGTENLKGNNNSFDEDRNKIPQNNMQTCTLNLKNFRADNFGSEGSSSECSFDDFENGYETASVNSQLSALEELEEFEDLNDVNNDQSKDASFEKGISESLETEAKSKNEPYEDDLTTDVKVCAKNGHKTATKVGKVRCRIPSRDSALGTRKSSICSQSSETGSESSANFYGPGDKYHEVKVQRVSLTSLPGFDMPDFIRANLEASLEKIEHGNNEEQVDGATNYRGEPVGNSVTDELLAKIPPVSSDDRNTSTVIAKLRTKKRFHKTAEDEKSKLYQHRTAKTGQQEEAEQSYAKKSTDTQKERRDVRPKISKQQKPTLETIKITESEIVMIVTNEQNSTSPSPKVPLFQSDEGPAPFSKQQMLISENKHEQGALHTKVQQRTTDKVLNQHDVKNVNEISEKERSVFKEQAVLSRIEAKDRMTSDMDNQATDSAKCAAATSNARKQSDYQSRIGTSSLNEMKSKIPLSTRQLSLERKKIADDNFENSEVSYDLQEAIIEARTHDNSSRLQFRLSPSEDNDVTLPEDSKTKPASPAETKITIPLLFRNEESQESVGVDSQKQKPSRIPVSSKTVQREAQVVLHGRCLDMDKSNNEQMPDFAVSTATENSNILYKTPEKELASNDEFSPVTKTSKIPVLSKNQQSQCNFVPENINVQSLESYPNQTSKKEEQQINFRKDDSQVLLPIEKKSGIPLPKSGLTNIKVLSENNQQNMTKGTAPSHIGNKSKTSQSRIPLPKNPTVKLSSSVEDQKAVWIKNEQSVEEEDSYIFHNPLATSTPVERPSQLPMANSRISKLHNKNEELKDEHDSENDDGRQTLLQRYMISENRRIEEIIRLQKTNPKT